MKLSEARKIIEDEIECVKRFKEGCGHECQFCDLVKEDKEIIEAYEFCLNLIEEKEKQPDVLYLCKYHKDPYFCKHTSRIEDALNFEELAEGKWVEKASRNEEDSMNKLSCSSCDQFGIGCGDCEVSDDD